MRRRPPALAASVAIVFAVASGCAPSAPPLPAAGDTSDVDPGVGRAPAGAASTGAGDLSNAELDHRISGLRDVVVPPVGTIRGSVDGVYGEPRVEEFGGMGNRTLYPMHVYELLPAEGRSEFRARLYVTYRGDRVFRAAINHICVAKQRVSGLTGSRAQEVKAEILAERRQVLADLEAIRERYRAQLSEAAWAW